MSMTIEDFTKRRMRVIMKEPVVEENVRMRVRLGPPPPKQKTGLILRLTLNSSINDLDHYDHTYDII